MEKEKGHTAKNHRLLSRYITTSVLYATMIAGCQTSGTKQNLEMAHVISRQELLIDAVIAERNHPDVKAKIAKSKALANAEEHLITALDALKQSCQSLEEIARNGQQ